MGQAKPAGDTPPLVLADHPALDFLNTEARPAEVRLDWLSDGAALLSWMRVVGLLSEEDVAHIQAAHARGDLDDVAARVRDFREWLRGLVEERRGSPASADPSALAPLTATLAVDDAYTDVEVAADGELRLIRRRRWARADPLLAIIAEQAAALIVEEDWQLVRACEGANCTNHFIDRSKTHKRRWCSMAICGNRAKVAAHRARRVPRSPTGPTGD